MVEPRSIDFEGCSFDPHSRSPSDDTLNLGPRPDTSQTCYHKMDVKRISDINTCPIKLKLALMFNKNHACVRAKIAAAFI